jgi:hypothetical protein
LIELEKPLFKKYELDRIKTQSTYEEIYLSTHIWNKMVTQDGNRKDIDPLVPIASTISEISSDLIYGEFPYFNFQDDTSQSAVSAFFKQRAKIGHDIKIELLEQATYNSAIGMIWWYLFVQDGQVYWRFKKPQHSTWVNGYFGIEEIKFYDLVDETDKAKVYDIEEFVNDNGVIRLTYYTVTVDRASMVVKKIETTDESVIENIDVIPVIPIYNQKYMGEALGKSDYEGKQQIFAEIDNRIDQINSILQDHSDPWLFVPAGVLDQYGNLQRSQGKVVEKSIASSNTDNSVEFGTWDASMAAQFQQIEWLIRLAYGTSRIAGPLTPFPDFNGGNAESGRALKHRSVTTVAMIERKRVYQEQAIKKFFELAKMLDKDLKNINTENLMIEWSDGLPTDEQELTELTLSKVRDGIVSKLDANQRLEGNTLEQAQAEMDQVKKEQTDEAEIASSASAPLTF